MAAPTGDGVDYYALLGVEATASTEAVRNAYKDAAMKHHPDRGGDTLVWANIQKAYDTLCDLQRRAVYDRTRGEAASGAEAQFAQKFGEGAFDLADTTARGKKGGMNILKQMAEVKRDDERMRESKRTAVVQKGFEMSHTAGFEAWLRNQKGVGQHGLMTADDLLRDAKHNRCAARAHSCIVAQHLIMCKPLSLCKSLLIAQPHYASLC